MRITVVGAVTLIAVAVIVAWVLRRLAEGGRTRSGDLLAYLLFDGGFAAELIALGRADARAHHEKLCAFFAEPAQ